MKPLYGVVQLRLIMSLPTRERGLKRKHLRDGLQKHIVAPYAGAWIETDILNIKEENEMSLPTRERGLKPPL